MNVLAVATPTLRLLLAYPHTFSEAKKYQKKHQNKMGNATSGPGGVSLNDYSLPNFAPAPVAEKQEQDVFEAKLEHMVRTRLVMVQANFALRFPDSPDAAVDWAAEAPICAVPTTLADATLESFRGATLTELAALFAMPLNEQLLPDSRSFGIVRKNVDALHPDRRRERSKDLYAPAQIALEQLHKLLISNRDLFVGLTDRDTTYRPDDMAVLPASLRPIVAAAAPPKPPGLLSDGADAAAMDVEEEGGEDAAVMDDPNAPITPEEREAIRSVMRHQWEEWYIPSEQELREIKHRLRTGTLSMGARLSAENRYELSDVDLEARARALLLRDPDEIVQSGACQTPGQGAITSSALVIPPKPIMPRFFQGMRVADRALVFAGDSTYAGGSAVSFYGNNGGSSDLVGNTLARAYAPKAPHDMNVVVPVRPEDNSDVLAKYEERALMYTQPLALSTIRLDAPLIINSAHNEARGDVAAARASGIASLRPGGNGGHRVKRTKAKAVTLADETPVELPPPDDADDGAMIENRHDVTGEESSTTTEQQLQLLQEETMEEEDEVEDGDGRAERRKRRA